MVFFSLLRCDFIKYKYRYNLRGLVQVHHIIPLEWKTHKNLFDYDIDKGYNLILMPTKEGKKILNTNRRIHDGGHLEYNKYIYQLLESGECPYSISNKMRKKIINNEEILW